MGNLLDGEEGASILNEIDGYSYDSSQFSGSVGDHESTFENVSYHGSPLPPRDRTFNADVSSFGAPDFASSPIPLGVGAPDRTFLRGVEMPSADFTYETSSSRDGNTSYTSTSYVRRAPNNDGAPVGPPPAANRTYNANKQQTYRVTLDGTVTVEKQNNAMGNATPANNTFTVTANKTYNVPANTTADVPANKTFDVIPNRTYNAPGNKTYNAPGNTTYNAPGNTTYNAPGNTTYNAPGNTTYNAPGNTTYNAPGNTTYNAPGNRTHNQNATQAIARSIDEMLNERDQSEMRRLRESMQRRRTR